MSYGLNGSYAVNEKLKIRVGINKVDLGYSTDNVVLYEGARASAVSGVSKSPEHITYDDSGRNLSILSAQSLSIASAPEVVATNANSSLNQEFGFIELPVEIEYAILSKKLGLNVIGGFSTFTSYSANFGLGVNYNVSNKIKLNLEPMFKYQINTFSDTSGDFRPYFIGIYTGLSYKF